MNNHPLLSVVIPVYQESEGLSVALAEIVSSIESLQESYELIIIDDGSMDETWNIIQAEARKYPCLSALRLSRNFGKESALYAGLENSKGDAVIVMDGDLQHPPALIPEMFGLWQKGQTDIVEGVKKERGRESLSYKLGAKFFYKIFSRITGHQLDNATDFKLMDRRVVDSLLKMGEVNRFFRGLTAWLGFRSKQIEFEVRERAGGESGWSTFNLFKLSLTAFTAFSTLPLHLVTFFGFVFLILSFFLGIQTLYNKVSGSAVTGFATVILLLLIMGSFLMISLGIIGEYLARVYKEVKGRPHYIAVDKIESHSKKLK